MRLRVTDTTVLIDHLRGHEPARARLQELLESSDGSLAASEVSRVELLSGMRSHERRATRELISLLDWTPVDERIAERAGALGRQYRHSHSGIGAPDLIIAATAELRSAELWTTNIRHFPMFPDLEPPY